MKGNSKAQQTYRNELHRGVRSIRRSLSLYKSPKEALILSLNRELMDVRHAEYSKEAVTEYIRGTIANINGIYYVVSIGGV